jgi:putative DNA primase/helicase
MTNKPNQEGKLGAGRDESFISAEMQPEVAEQLSREFDADLDQALDDYLHHNGRYREDEFCHLARQLGRDDRKVTRAWLDARGERLKRRADEKARLRAWARSLIIKAEPEPGEREATAKKIASLLDEPTPQAEPGDKAAEEPEPEPAAEAPPAAEAWTRADAVGAELKKETPLDNAKKFTDDKLMLSNGSSRALDTYFYQGSWWQWNKAFYEKAPEQRISDMVCNYLDKSWLKTLEGAGSKEFKPVPKDLSFLMTFLRTCVGLDDRNIPPLWLDERPSPKPAELLAFRNCLVDVTTGKTYGHDPRLWLHDGVSFNYDPKAKCPWWEWFLKEAFPSDEEVRNCIEEQVGYGMTTDNQFEKAALWIGEPRSGRGTIAAIQELLVGVNGHCSLNVHSWHNNENSRQGMVGKRVGIFHDIRLKPPKQYGNVSFDPGGIGPQSQQLLLELISGDFTEFGRKYIDAWKGLPFIKFILISNQVPNFNDPVLITRMIAIEFTRSFLDVEKPELKKVLLPAECPGIANRCLAAYRRLLERGRFVQPASGQALLNRVKAQVDPWTAFMDAYWLPDPEGEGTPIRVFNRAFRHWCLETETYGLVKTSKSNIIQSIKRLPKWKWLRAFRPAAEPRHECYGIKLKAGVTLPEKVLKISTPEELLNTSLDEIE